MIHDVCDGLLDTMKKNMVRSDSPKEFKFTRKLLHMSLDIQDVHHVDVTPLLSFEVSEFTNAAYIYILNRVMDDVYNNQNCLIQTDEFRRAVLHRIKDSKAAEDKQISLINCP